MFYIPHFCTEYYARPLTCITARYTLQKERIRLLCPPHTPTYTAWERTAEKKKIGYIIVHQAGFGTTKGRMPALAEYDYGGLLPSRLLHCVHVPFVRRPFLGSMLPLIRQVAGCVAGFSTYVGSTNSAAPRPVFRGLGTFCHEVHLPSPWTVRVIVNEDVNPVRGERECPLVALAAGRSHPDYVRRVSCIPYAESNSSGNTTACMSRQT